MGLKDRMDRYERGQPKDAPICASCGLSFAQEELVVEDETGLSDGREYKREPGCPHCREPRRRWAERTGWVNEVRLRIVYDVPLEDDGIDYKERLRQKLGLGGEASEADDS